MQTENYKGGNLNSGGGTGPKIVELGEITQLLTKSQKEKIFSGCNVTNLAKIFEDPTMMSTVKSFFENGMNVAKTARAMYMHRNTLLYRLNVIRKQTGLDLKDFKMAVTFEILHSLYSLK